MALQIILIRFNRSEEILKLVLTSTGLFFFGWGVGGDDLSGQDGSH